MERMLLEPHMAAGCRTVVSIADHFEELKQRARELSAKSQSSQRGYFTPSEDEEVKHLLVSYWQSRNALIELVLDFQRQHHLETEQDERTFLIAYSGALVLVDAARFLRDEFHTRPLVRTKLNEPDPYFGIAPNTYEQLQKSLTSPIHAWRLYHAAKYMCAHRESIQANVDDALFPLMTLIEHLQDRLEISLEAYSIARIRSRVRELNQNVGQGLLAQALYGLQKTVASFTANLFVKSNHVPELRRDIAEQLRPLLQPGDLLITRKEFAVTNYFLPGFWPHAALFLGSAEDMQRMGIAAHDNVRPRWQKLLNCDPGESLRVLEAMKDGVHIRSLRSPFGVDAITVLRPQLEQADIVKAIARGIFHEGKPYDFDFDFNRSDRLVCTEVIYRSYENVGNVSFGLKKRAGRWTLAAEDIIHKALRGEHFVPFAVFSPTHHHELALNEAAGKLLRSTLKPQPLP